MKGQKCMLIKGAVIRDNYNQGKVIDAENIREKNFLTKMTFLFYYSHSFFSWLLQFANSKGARDRERLIKDSFFKLHALLNKERKVYRHY